MRKRQRPVLMQVLRYFNKNKRLLFAIQAEAFSDW